MTTKEYLKYMCIILYSTLTSKTVVDMFGNTYVVAGNVVQKIRSRK